MILETQHYMDYGKPKSRNTSYKYDKMGNLIEVVDDDKEFGYKVVYSYDKEGNLISQSGDNEKEPLHVYTYDDKGRKTTATNHIYKDYSKYTITKYEYDSDGLETSAITYDNNDKQLNKSTNKYDKNGNLISSTMEFPEGITSWAFVYNDKNQRISSTNSDKDKSTCKYDKNGRLIEEVQESNGNKSTLKYSYDTQGNLLEISRNGYLEKSFIWEDHNWKNNIPQSDWYDWLKYNNYSRCDPRPWNEKDNDKK